ncbi:glycosyltransferase family 2 protein [Alkalihalobacterium chitinilyticum]|uniref:Glucosyl-3-phosphoglycerate synthase n=1 Tax=Alkalihalobacterium chitinilyticum TaxID=2980103 RepID=A0ABT5VAB9_9BACI|nr:glycosyltransferase family 2 protein [Alkalihalobacterium chitinilyticum]MDE5412230.1 glycosyltransferase family 2 protein [Alkalihalobacterium chitinilyticum]
MNIQASVVIPAFNEQERIEHTLKTLKEQSWVQEIITVNDGSSDATGEICEKYSDVTVHFKSNHGKGQALKAGWEKANGLYIVSLDADIGSTASEGKKLLTPLTYPFIDVVIGTLPPSKKRGFGFVKRKAQNVIYKKTGKWVTSPLSGQRAFHRKWLPALLNKNYNGFGIELAMTIDLINAGAQIVEVDTNITHRHTGKNLSGFLHRGKQWLHIEAALRGG